VIPGEFPVVEHEADAVVGLALLDGAAAGEELLHADKALAARITPDSRPAPERTVFFVSISFPPVSAISNV
jgi:hypothetical protein